jgi:hypothetical protein
MRHRFLPPCPGGTRHAAPLCAKLLHMCRWMRRPLSVHEDAGGCAALLKEGETIKINVRRSSGSGGGFLSGMQSSGGAAAARLAPPPAGGVRLAPPPAAGARLTPPQSSASGQVRDRLPVRCPTHGSGHAVGRTAGVAAPCLAIAGVLVTVLDAP